VEPFDALHHALGKSFASALAAGVFMSAANAEKCGVSFYSIVGRRGEMHRGEMQHCCEKKQDQIMNGEALHCKHRCTTLKISNQSFAFAFPFPLNK